METGIVSTLCNVVPELQFAPNQLGDLNDMNTQLPKNEGVKMSYLLASCRGTRNSKAVEGLNEIPSYLHPSEIHLFSFANTIISSRGNCLKKPLHDITLAGQIEIAAAGRRTVCCSRFSFMVILVCFHGR
jgi:hypothetical protein